MRSGLSETCLISGPSKFAVSPAFYSLPENKKVIILQGAGITKDRV